MDAGRYAEACPKLETSERLSPASGTLLNLGDCYEHLGRIGSAWKAFEGAAARAKAGGKRERERVARERAASLVPRLSRVVLVAPRSVPVDLVVELDGAPLAVVTWGAPLVVDAGAHTLVARASGRRSFSTTLGPVAEGQTLSFQMPELAHPSDSYSLSGSSAPASSRIDGQRLGAIVSASIGAAGLVAGSAFGLKSISRHSKSDEHCPEGRCDQRGVDAMDEARTAGNWATAGFIVGGVGLTAASLLWFVRPFSGPAARTQIGVGPNAFIVRGNF